MIAYVATFIRSLSDSALVFGSLGFVGFFLIQVYNFLPL